MLTAAIGGGVVILAGALLALRFYLRNRRERERVQQRQEATQKRIEQIARLKDR